MWVYVWVCVCARVRLCLFQGRSVYAVCDNDERRGSVSLSIEVARRNIGLFKFSPARVSRLRAIQRKCPCDLTRDIFVGEHWEYRHIKPTIYIIMRSNVDQERDVSHLSPRRTSYSGKKCENVYGAKRVSSITPPFVHFFLPGWRTILAVTTFINPYTRHWNRLFPSG